MKPGDKVYRVHDRAAECVFLKPIQAGICVGPDLAVDARWPRVRVHFGWIAVESIPADQVFATEDEAKARVAVLVKKRLKAIRAEAKKLAALDLSRVKTQDRTGQIKKREMAKIRAAGGAS